MNEGRLLPYLQLLRLPAVVTVWADILAAHLIVTAGRPEGTLLAAQLGITTALYWSGMVLNDWFDRDLDRRERPRRPLPSGRVSPRQAWLLGVALMGAGIALAAATGPRQLAVTLLLAAAVLAYDGALKHGPLGPLAMGLCRYLNWLLGLSVLPLAGANLTLALPILLYIAALTTLSRVEADAASRIPLGLCAGGLVITGVAVAVLVGTGVLDRAWALAPLALFIAALLADLRRTLGAYSPANLQRSVRHLLLGIVGLDAILVAAGGPWWGAILVLSLLIPGRLLSRVIPVT